MRILILGAGFAGLWAALGAARKRDEIGATDLDIVVVDRNPYHAIRVRNYEVDISDVTVPLGEVLDPVDVRHIVAEIEGIDTERQIVSISSGDGRDALPYDRLVLTLGSRLVRPPIPGLASHGFDVDTFAAAQRLDAHLATLATRPDTPGRGTVVVVGAGFTGIEVAAEMPARLARHGVPDPQVILLDPNRVVGATIGAAARPVITEALAALKVDTRLGARIRDVGETSVTLESGESIATRTVVWCAGLSASPLATALSPEHDSQGRLPVDHFMRAQGLANVFAAGDVASCLIDGSHPTVMSCQFARPMGRFAGHNVVADLCGQPMLPLTIDWYVTVLDLGAWGALYTEGWDRRIRTSGAAAKATKQTINRQRIYPPRNGSRADLFAAAAPDIQAAPPARTSAPRP